MKNTFIFIGIYFLTLLIPQTSRIAAQSACCPDFYLSDAVEICPTESACVHDGTDPIGQFTAIRSACQETYHTYTVFPNDPTYSHTWSVSFMWLWGNSILMRFRLDRVGRVYLLCGWNIRVS